MGCMLNRFGLKMDQNSVTYSSIIYRPYSSNFDIKVYSGSYMSKLMLNSKKLKYQGHK